MGDGAIDIGSPKANEIYGPPPPPPPAADDKDKSGDKKVAAPPPTPPPSGQELKKLTSEVKSLGVKLPADMLDEQGNLKPERLADAKKLLIDQAEARKKSDLGASARLLQKAVTLDPRDANLRLEASQRWVEWAEHQPNKEAKLAQLERAFEFIKDVEADPQKDPVMATAKFTLAKRLCAVHIGTTHDYEKATKYLQLAVRSGNGFELKQMLEELKANPHPEVYGKYDNPYEFFANELIEVYRWEDAKGVFEMGAKDTAESDPAKSKLLKQEADIVAKHLDPKPDYDKYTAWSENDQKLMDIQIDSEGHYREAFAGDAKARVKSETEGFLKTDEMKRLVPGSTEYNVHLTRFLSQKTEYHLLPQKDKTDVLTTGWTVYYNGKTETVPGTLDKFDPAVVHIRSSKETRIALYLKRQGDYWMSKEGPMVAIAHYKKSLALNPDDTMARIGLARAQTAMGVMAGNPRLKEYCFNSAAMTLGGAAEGDPNKWQILHATGDLLLASGHPKEAIGFLNEALYFAKATGAPEYSLNDKLVMQGPGGAEAALNGTPLGESLQKAVKAQGEAISKERYTEDVKPRERLMQDMMMKGVKTSEVAAWWNKTYTSMPRTEDKIGPEEFLEFALKHPEQHRGDLEKAYGKLPLDKDGKLDPEFQKAAQGYLDDRKKKAEDAAKKQGLDPTTPAFKEAVDKILSQKDDLGEAYTALLAPDDPSNPGRSLAEKLTAFNKVQGILLEASAEEAKGQGPAGMKKAFQYYQQAGEAFKRAYDLTGDRRFMRTGAKCLYQAAYIARRGGDEEQARQLFLKGVTGLQFGGEDLLRDPQALKLMGDGLMEVGKYKEAKALYDSAQDPLPQYYGAHEDLPEDFADRLKLSSSYCTRMVDIEKKLGVEFFDNKDALEQKQRDGKITPQEKADLERMQNGYNTLKRLAGLQFPPSVDSNELPAIRELRDNIVAAIQEGDVKKFDELMGKAQRQIQNAETLQMADSLRKKTLLPQLPPQVQDYIKRTNDWSILRTEYKEGDHLPEDWNPAQLNDMPVLKALREWDEKNPEQAKQIRAALEIFGKGRMVNGEACSDLDQFNADVDKVAAALFKTGPDGKLPVDPKGSRIFEPTETFGAWFQDATEIDLRDKPEAWMSSNLNDYRQSLGAIGKTLGSFEAIRKDYKDTQQKLTDAQKAGNQVRVKILQGHLDELKGQIKELKANFKAAFKVQAAEFNGDVDQFGIQCGKLKKVNSSGNYPYQAPLDAAKGKVKSAGDRLDLLGDDADPAKVLDEMIAGAQDLAGAQAVMLKGVTLVHTANVQGFGPGEWKTKRDDSYNTGDYMDRKGPRPAATKQVWESDPKWAAAMADIDKQFDAGAAMDGAAIDKFLGTNLEHLKATDKNMFKDLPTTLREGISLQLNQLNAMRAQKKDAGEEVREYDTLIEKYQEAQKALDAGNVDKALALFRVATESKRQSQVHTDFENFQSDQKWKAIALEVAIITAAAAATAVTMGALAPVAGAAAAAGTAAIATEVGLVLLEGAVFVGYEMTLRTALFAAKEEFQIKSFGLSTVEDPWRDIHGMGDLGWKVLTNAAMLKALKIVGEGYQILTLSERAMARAGATALLEDAAAVGMRRAMMREMLQREMADLSFGGKALYNAGAFGAEAVGMQAWSNAQIGLDMLYQRVAHGKKLEWKQYTAALEKTNSVEQIEHGLATLVGLKLGGLATHPIIGRFQSAEQVSASQKIKLDLFLKTKGQFETRLKAEMDKAEAAGKPFEMTKELRGEAQRLRELGQEAMEIGTQLEKGKGLKVFTEDERAAWKESSEWLGRWMEYSGKEQKLSSDAKVGGAGDDKKAAPPRKAKQGAGAKVDADDKAPASPQGGKTKPQTPAVAPKDPPKAKPAADDPTLGELGKHVGTLLDEAAAWMFAPGDGTSWVDRLATLFFGEPPEGPGGMKPAPAGAYGAGKVRVPPKEPAKGPKVMMMTGGGDWSGNAHPALEKFENALVQKDIFDLTHNGSAGKNPTAVRIGLEKKADLSTVTDALKGETPKELKTVQVAVDGHVSLSELSGLIAAARAKGIDLVVYDRAHPDKPAYQVVEGRFIVPDEAGAKTLLAEAMKGGQDIEIAFGKESKTRAKISGDKIEVRFKLEKAEQIEMLEGIVGGAVRGGRNLTLTGPDGESFTVKSAGGSIEIKGSGGESLRYVPAKTGYLPSLEIKLPKDADPERAALLLRVAAEFDPAQLKRARVTVEGLNLKLGGAVKNNLSLLIQKSLWGDVSSLQVGSGKELYLEKDVKGSSLSYRFTTSLPFEPGNTYLSEHLAFESAKALGVSGPSDPKAALLQRYYRSAARQAVELHKNAKGNKGAEYEPFLDARYVKTWTASAEQLADFAKSPKQQAQLNELFEKLGNYSQREADNFLGFEAFNGFPFADNAFELNRIFAATRADPGLHLPQILKNAGSVLGTEGQVELYGAGLGMVYKAYVLGDKAALNEYDRFQKMKQEAVQSGKRFRFTIIPEDRSQGAAYGTSKFTKTPEWIVEELDASGQTTHMLTVEVTKMNGKTASVDTVVAASGNRIPGIRETISTKIHQITGHEFGKPHNQGEGLVVFKFSDAGGREADLLKMVQEALILEHNSNPNAKATEKIRVMVVLEDPAFPSGAKTYWLEYDKGGQWKRRESGGVFEAPAATWAEPFDQAMGWRI